MERPVWLRIIGLICLLALDPLLCPAQSSLHFQHFTQEDGLSNNYVRSMCQDHLGFMWIGTENGLNRFDGHHFLVYRFDPDNRQSISDNWITSLLEDQAENLWAGTRQGLNRLDRTTGHFERIPLRLEEGSILNYWVNDIFEDRSHQLWICSERYGVLRLKTDARTGIYFLERLPLSRSYVEEGIQPTHLLQGVAGDLWIRHNKGMDRLNLAAETSERFLFSVDSEAGQRDNGGRKTILDSKGNIILAGNQRGLFFLNPGDEHPRIRPLSQHLSGSPGMADFQNKRIYTLCLQGQDRLWVGAQDTIFPLNQRVETSATAAALAYDFPLDVHTLLEDKQGRLWVGTAGGGFSVETTSRSPFRFLQHQPEDESSIARGVVRSLVEDQLGFLWLGFLGEGLEQYRLDRPLTWQKLRSLKHIPGDQSSLLGNDIIKILRSRSGHLWIATNGSGLNRLDPATGSIESFVHAPSDSLTLSQNRIWGLCEDKEGFIWVGGFNQGLNRLDPRTGIVRRFRLDPANENSLLNDHVKSLLADRQGTIWIGTNQGLSRLDPLTSAFTHYVHDANDPGSISSGTVWGIYEDRQGQLWVATGVGLNRMNQTTGTFKKFYEKDGLPSNTAYGLLEDHQGRLWVSTDDGLAIRMSDRSQRAFQPITRDDGLQATSFVPKSYYYSDATRLLFFGATNGLVVVEPALLLQGKTSPKLMLHAVSKLDPAAGTGEFADYFISHKDGELRLSHTDQFITFSFADLVWDKNKRFQYQYQLEGINQSWMPVSDDMEITFSNLPPGRYVLRARSLDFFGESQQEVELLHIRMFPPWWRRWWAYAIYSLLLAGLVLVVYRILLHRQRDRQEADNLRNLNDFKDRFFANISHEFRTPLTIILGMIDQIEKDPKHRMQEGAGMIRKNGADLLDLINQILELQKLESGNLTVKMQRGDIIPYLQGVARQFRALAQSKQQILEFLPQSDSLSMDFDSEKILRIVSNLLSNAIKYTPEGGEIRFTIQTTDRPDLGPTPYLLLSVQDTGAGISEEEVDRIFDRFFRASNQDQTLAAGTGIGLSLTLELVKLLEGRIEVNSQLGQGTTVQVLLPVTRRAAPGEEVAPLAIQSAVFGTQGVSTEQSPPADDRPVALVVEDNPDVARYLQFCLQAQYTVHWANDGRQGIELALESIPDIIISDVMRPEKDGFELCETLKEDTRTSHIPIILLTAKSEVEARITGLRQGADDYLAKPFHEQELLVRMANLLNIRRQLQERYRDLYAHPPAGEGSALPPSREDAFILQLKEAFDVRMDDPDFDLDTFSKELFLSRSQLGRKVKALTGQSLAVYLRSLRLQKARQLLLSSELPIKEIAYDVGFPNPAYFSTSYSDEYGESPSKTRDSRDMRK